MTPQRMTQDPDPASPGDVVEFCYDVDGCTFPIELTGTWRPSGQTFKHTVTGPDTACFEQTVPDGTTGGAIEDGSSQSLAFGMAIA